GLAAGVAAATDVRLDDAYVLGPRALGAVAFVVGHLLTFAQILEARAFDGRHVEEHVLAGGVADEAKTLVSQTLDRTFCHLCLRRWGPTPGQVVGPFRSRDPAVLVPRTAPDVER